MFYWNSDLNSKYEQGSNGIASSKLGIEFIGQNKNELEVGTKKK